MFESKYMYNLCKSFDANFIMYDMYIPDGTTTLYACRSNYM